MYDFDGNFMILQAVKVSVIHQLTNGKELLAESDENSEALALIIDGKSFKHDTDSKSHKQKKFNTLNI